MQRIGPFLLLALLCSGASACVSSEREAPIVSEVSDPVVRVAEALVAGSHADTQDDADLLRMTAGILQTHGARPQGETPDLGTYFAERAADLGAQQSPQRGRTAGPAYRNGDIPPGGQAAFREIFRSGQTAVIALAPRNAERMKLAVTTSNGQSVCEVEGQQRIECRWTPIWTEPVTIEVSNLTTGRAEYFLITN